MITFNKESQETYTKIRIYEFYTGESILGSDVNIISMKDFMFWLTHNLNIYNTTNMSVEEFCENLPTEEFCLSLLEDLLTSSLIDIKFSPEVYPYILIALISIYIEEVNRLSEDSSFIIDFVENTDVKLQESVSISIIDSEIEMLQEFVPTVTSNITSIYKNVYTKYNVKSFLNS